MTRDEALTIAAATSAELIEIADICDQQELSYMDEPVISKIHALDFRAIGDTMAALETAARQTKPLTVWIVTFEDLRDNASITVCATEEAANQLAADLFNQHMPSDAPQTAESWHAAYEAEHEADSSLTLWISVSEKEIHS